MPPLLIRDIMTRDVLTLSPDTSIREAAELLSTEMLGGAPVTVGRTLVGMLSAHDLMDFIASLAAAPEEVRAVSEQGILEDHTVEEAMSRAPLHTVLPTAPVEKAAESMSVDRMHRLPVVEDGELVGIVSTMDIVRAVAERKLSHRTFVFPSPLAMP